jgi:hypothetical protein
MCPYYIGPAFRLMPEDVSKIRALYPSGTVVVNPNDGRWDDPSITFSFVPDGTAMESPGKGSDLFAKMQQALGSNWQSVFRQALNLWAEATDADGTPDSNSLDNALRFTEHIDNGRPFDFSGLSQGDANAGDIRIGAHKFDSPGGVLAHAYFPPPNSITAAGDAHFASEENWKNLSGLALSPSTAPISTGGGHGSGGSANYGALRHSDAQANDLALLAFFSPPTPGTSSARAIAEEDVILPVQIAAPREQSISIETAAGCMESDDDLVTFSNKARDRATDGDAVTTADHADWLPNSALL